MVLCRLYNQNSIFCFKQQRSQRFPLFSNYPTTFAISYKNRATKLKKMMSHYKQVDQLLISQKTPENYDVDGLNKIVINQSDLTVIHLNISYLALYNGKIKLFLSLIKTKFDIICLSESKITKTTP